MNFIIHKSDKYLDKCHEIFLFPIRNCLPHRRDFEVAVKSLVGPTSVASLASRNTSCLGGNSTDKKILLKNLLKILPKILPNSWSRSTVKKNRLIAVYTGILFKIDFRYDFG